MFMEKPLSKLCKPLHNSVLLICIVITFAYYLYADKAAI